MDFLTTAQPADQIASLLRGRPGRKIHEKEFPTCAALQFHPPREASVGQWRSLPAIVLAEEESLEIRTEGLQEVFRGQSAVLGLLLEARGQEDSESSQLLL